MAAPYSEAFKAQMVRRMIGPPKIGGLALSRETGVPQATLWRWVSEVRKAGKLEALETAGRKKWTVGEKGRVLAAAEGLEGEELGALLRSEGLHEEQLEAWRDALAGDAGTRAAVRQEKAEARKQIKQLERELRRKEKALAEAAALLVLEKKLQAMDWGNEGNGTGQKRDE